MSYLKKKSIDGIFWALAEKYGTQLIKMILGIILARLLSPADYGLIGMIMVFFVIANVFIDSGFGMAYIQRSNVDEKDASTIFYFNLSVSIFFYILIWFSSPAIAKFYDQPQLVELCRVMGVILIINSFSVMQIAKLTREVNFKKKTLITLISSVLSGLIGITAALLNYGVWSLVIQSLVNSFLRSVSLWIFYKWKPLLIFSLASLKAMFSFSSWALLTSLFRTIFDNLYFLVIGKYFPAASLGYYTKARQFQEMISKQSSLAIGSIAFPVFSKLQDNKLKLKSSMKKFSQFSLFFIAPISALLIVIAKPLFLLLLTEKWLPMVSYFQLLMIVGFLYPLHMVNVQVLSAQARVNLTFRLEIIKNVFRVLNIIIMYRFGVIYIIYGELFLSFLALIINTYFTKKLLNYGMLEQLRDLSVIIFISFSMVLMGLYLIQMTNSNYLKIILNVIVLSSFYIIASYYFNRGLLMAFIQIVKSKFNGA